jgi:two-component system OmpR family response regulator
MDVLRYADVVLDERRREVSRGGRTIDLTATEFSLLQYFLQHPRRVVSKPQLLREVWRYEAGGSVNLVETYVSYLRRKLEREGPPLIRTVRQAGYMLDAGDMSQ